MSRHTPPQFVRPAPQETAHVPREHTWPVVQVIPHNPQLALSVWVSRQTPSQLVVPPPQETTQVPNEHT